MLQLASVGIVSVKIGCCTLRMVVTSSRQAITDTVAKAIYYFHQLYSELRRPNIIIEDGDEKDRIRLIDQGRLERKFVRIAYVQLVPKPHYIQSGALNYYARIFGSRRRMEAGHTGSGRYLTFPKLFTRHAFHNAVSSPRIGPCCGD
ncbi:hypothetical protein A0H81_06698 [Grifola frondosa]|uniref:Uncharacterized protein n=1 Tax=Grifola frondosa TaxID=5627 RepID=A0A1C7M8A2_GRIFR|nr:hypothetical protein A0H81_06698 [Grifola frondosa]